MKGYRDYMDRQQVSPALHDKLLALEQQEIQPKPQSRQRWQPALAMAACLCLVLGVCWGWNVLSPAKNASGNSAVNIILSPVRGCVNASDHACSISRGTLAPRGLPYIGSPHTGCPKCFICTRI